MRHLHRAQIYIGEDQIKNLKMEAQKSRLAVSELIRMAIDRFLQSKDKSANWNKDSLTKSIGKIKLSTNDASAKHDDYLYGH